MDYQLKGKIALIVASSQGLGRAIAIELAKEGANVMLAARNEEKLKQVQEEIRIMTDETVLYTVTDITQKDEIRQLIDKTAEQLGGIDILVNNSGGPPAGTFAQMSDDDWQNSFELNLLSYIRLIREAMPYLKKRGGKIINIASTSIKEPIPGLILSNTFRTAVVGMSKTLAEELAPYGILINTVAPGRIATERVQHLDQFNADKRGMAREKIQELAEKNIPLGRYGEPEEFARVVAFLASGANTYMTGSAFLVDGGMVKSI
ncbi:SDR family oxidoreductase [Peribacillus sp. SCS-155]|uniref:SDR family oxidoreductase n=1 Tax=Peribacillus sedimenti TaxID=3115297 RepID=UPI003906C0F0